MLRESAEAVCVPKATQELSALKGLIARRQLELRSAALELGSRLYVEKPVLFRKKLHGWWNTWRQ